MINNLPGKVIFFFLFSAAACTLLSSSLSADTITLERAVVIALKNNRSYLASIERAKAGALKVREVWGNLWPSLSTDVAYTRQWAEAGMASRVAGNYAIK